MFQFILDHRLDCWMFASAIVAVSVSMHVVLRRRYGAGIGRKTWLFLAIIIGIGAIAAEAAGNHERNRLRDMLQGIAPTYAQELERMGHDKITLDTKPNDPLYLSMISAEIRWLKANPGVNDVYTFRKYPDGKVRLIVDSETDYNHNGVYDGEREQRTPIGEIYDADPGLDEALTSAKPLFDGVPYTDRWGTWVSAYAPIYDEQGRVDGIAGVDYDAQNWISSILWNRVATLGFASIVAVILMGSSMTIAITRVELTRRIASEKERDRLQKELLTASRQAGMAEIATGVLHNVGNVLNSVNVSAGTVAETIRRSKVPAFGKAVALMQEHQQDLGLYLTSDDKGKKIPAYLVKLADFMAQEQGALLGELDHLHHSIDHIKQIVSAQQQFARQGEMDEQFALSDVIEDAIRIEVASLGRHGIAIDRQFAACPAIFGDKHKILQILVNLIANSKNAVDHPEIRTKKISLVIESFEKEQNHFARVRVIDTGVGITPENMNKLFQHGFTTRSDGHGFGLHSAAITARHMGGSLAATSDGAGKGATFTLELPAAAIKSEPEKVK